MLSFHSGSSNAVNSKSAVRECLDHAFGEGGGAEASVLVIHSTVGHNFPQVLAAAKDACPNATVIGCTGSGVIGRESVSEQMRAMAVMAVTGDECAVAFTDGLSGTNSADSGAKLAGQLKDQLDDINIFQFNSGAIQCFFRSRHRTYAHNLGLTSSHSNRLNACKNRQVISLGIFL